MNIHLSPSRVRVAAAGLVMLASAAAQAQFDPTRPHPAWLAAQIQATQSGAPEVTPEPPIPNAQILVTGPSRRFAIVDGKAVSPGQTYNGSKLLSIDGADTVWQRSAGREKSSMTPGVDKSLPGKGKREQQLANVQKKILNGVAQ